MCSECRKPLHGSTSRGRHGKYFSAYRCDNRGHYFRKTKKEFDQTIEDFVKSLDVSPEYIDELFEVVGEAFDKQQVEIHKDSVTIDLRLVQLRNQVRQAVDKIKMVNSETTIKYLEEDIAGLEVEIADLTAERETAEEQKPVDMEKMKAYVRYYLERLEELLLHYSNPVLQAKYFGVIFNEAPTYSDIVSGTPDCSKIKGVNTVFVPKKFNNNLMAGARGWEYNFFR